MKSIAVICVFIAVWSTGSTTTEITDFPYLVSVQQPGSGGRRHVCSGAILNSRWIITAAHCIEMFDDPHAFKIRAGSAHHDRTDVVTVDYTVEDRKLHPNFKTNGDSYEYDIGLLKVDKPIEFKDETASIALVADNFKFDDELKGIVAGWSPYMARTLESFIGAIEIKTVDKEKCEHDKTVRLTNTMLCVSVDGTTDKCHHDSGSPFVVDKKIAGVMVGEVGCADQPGVLTKITSEIRTWVETTIA